MLQHAIRAGLTALAAMLVAAGIATAAELGPQSVVRQFCQADGNGERITLPGWAALAPLLTWPYEPAWDTITLISGYNVRPPQPAEEHGLDVEVHYSIVGQLSPFGLNPESHVEVVTYHLQPDEHGNWRITGPLPPPHLFANQVDIDAMRHVLSEGDASFLANSVFVWKMFQSAGWNVPFQTTTDLLSSTTYRDVEAARAGDLVVYLRDGAPYHVGLLEAKDQVVSSTLNAGITRATVDAFPGEVRYLRLGRVDPVSEDARQAAPIPTPVLRATPMLAPRKTPTPAVKVLKSKKPPPTARQPKAKAAVKKRAKPPAQAAKHLTPTPRQRKPSQP